MYKGFGETLNSRQSTRCLNDHSIEDNHLDQTMRIIQLHIYLLMWSQATESVTNTAVTLGADVNISCDLDIKEIYWYRHKSPDPPVFILRTYSSTYEGAEYENSIFKLKYSVKTNSHLFIRNISTDELGVYYCVKTSEPQKFSNGTKIYINGLIKSCTNSSRGGKESFGRDVKESQFAEAVLLKHLSGSRSCQTVCSFSLLQSITDEGASEETENLKDF
ncbi:hypothetical protein G5714_021912 [Onychostoma macrolepis]|uniref:Ig-like domain-containing protein n=1 Tax=Onychostoma macrolepis TaxID=369639 RepID=A0A7J6BSU5_9TELE|nr:hypothetical protein G5714_021912 [Onychostoma macrolepis]